MAGDALRKLGLHESARRASPGSYTATVLTNRVLVITVKAASPGLAVREANALAAAFLASRHSSCSQELLVSNSLQQQIAKAQQRSAPSARRSATLRAAASLAHAARPS